MAIQKKTFVGFCLALCTASPALAEEWEVQQQSPTANLRLIYKGDAQVSYLFECTPDDVVLTELGVTDLLDLQTDVKVGDTPGSRMTAGAALMALSTDLDSAPDLKPAQAVPNATRGWDLTIRLSKKDKALRTLAKARFVSVFTTGYTLAVALDEPERQSVKSFLTQCGVKV